MQAINMRVQEEINLYLSIIQLDSIVLILLWL